ncbi:MAG: GNAT family N-acetyltransferase [Spirochaetota bacterium]
MKIIDLPEDRVGTYCKCLEDWSNEFDDEGGHKRRWYEENRRKGLRVKVAEEDDGSLVGMIQYIPVEQAPVVGKDLYYIYCVWVHGYDKGVGNRQHSGLGKALLHAAEEDVRALGAKGMVAWGLRIPVFMRSRWFKRQGYDVVDRDGMMELVLKSFVPGADKPRFIARGKAVEGGSDRVRLTSFMNGWCPAQNIVHERARRIATELPAQVEFQGRDTGDREVLLEYGVADGLFMDGKAIRTGPPPSYEKLRKAVEKRIRKRGLAGRD